MFGQATYAPKTVTNLATIVLCAVLAACGGGGGGGNGGGGGSNVNRNAVFAVDTTPIDISADLNQPTPNQIERTGTLTGATSTVYVFVELPANNLFRDGNVAISGTTGTLFLRPALPADLGVGVFQGNVVVRACNDANCASQIQGSPQVIPTTYEVTATTISLNPSDISITAEHRQSASADYSISTSGQPSPWTSAITYIDGSGWLTLDPPNGPGRNLVTATVTGQPPGMHRASVEFTTEDGLTSVTVPVTYTVTPSELDFPETSLTFRLDENTIAADLTQTLDIASGTGTDYDWTATADVDWLTLSPGTGTTGAAAPLDVIINEVAADIFNGDHDAVISLASSNPDVTPIDLPVRFERRAQYIRHVTPYLHYTGEVTPPTLAGERLDELQASDILFDGNPAVDVTPGSATDARLNDPLPSTAGRYPVAVPNSSGLPLNTAELVVVDAPTIPSAEFPVANTRRSGVLWDAERNTLYSGNEYGQTLDRYRLVGGAWVFDAVPMPGVFFSSRPTDIELSANGKELYIGGSPFSGDIIVRLDADTLQEIDRLPYRGRSLHALNNGLLLANGGELINPKTGEFRFVSGNYLGYEPNISYQSMVGDGSRVYLATGLSDGIRYLMYYDTRGDTLVQTTVELSGFGGVVTNYDGSVIFAGVDVYDGDLNLLGSLDGAVFPKMNRAGTAAYFLDTGSRPWRIIGKDLARPDGAGGFEDLFAPLDVVVDTPIFTVSPRGDAAFFVGDNEVEIVALP